MTTPADSHCSSPARRLLPWVLTGRLDAGDAQLADAHLRDCAECRAELVRERELADAVSAEDAVVHAPGAALHAFLATIEADVPPERAPSGRARRERRWLLAAVAVQAVVIAGLAGVMFARAPGEGAYVTLSRPAAVAPAAALRVVFTPDVPTGDLAPLLADVGATIVDGPTEAGVYTLAVAPGRSTAAALAALRADRRIRFVEPLAGAAR